MNVLYGGRRAVVVAVGAGTLRDGSQVVLARLRFPRGGEQTVFAAQLQYV